MALTNLSQITTSGISTLADINLNNLTGVAATFTGNVTVGGVLTYDDVTNIDSVGLITARSGVSITGGDLTLPDAIVHASDTNTKIRFPANDIITAETGGSEALRIDASGRVLVGTTTEGKSAADNLNIADDANCGVTIRSGTTNYGSIYFSDATTGAGEYDGYIQYSQNTQYLSFGVAQVERLRIDSSGRLLINKTTNRDQYYGGTYTGQLQVEGTNDATRLTQFIHNTNAASQPIVVLGKSRGTSVGSYTVVQNGDYLGTLSFQGADGDEMIEGARIDAIVSAAPGADDMPTALTFGVTADGASSTTEALRITSAGNLGINTTAPNAKLTVGPVSSSGFARGPVAIKAVQDGNSIPANIYLEELSGAEGYTLSIDSDGDLNFHNSGAADPTVTFSDGNNLGIGTDAPAVKLDIKSTDAIRVPVGTTGERPTGVAGYIRYNSSIASFEGHNGSEWAGIGGAAEVETAVSSTSATTCESFAKASYRSATIIAQITQGSSYQVGNYLLIHDGTTATLIEESAVATGEMLGAFTATISGSNVVFQVNMSSASSATVTTKMTKVSIP